MNELNYQEILASFADRLSPIQTKEELAWAVIDHIISKLRYDDCVIYFYDERRRCLMQIAASSDKKRDNTEIKNPIRIDPGEGIVGRVYLSGMPLIINDTSRTSNYIIDDRFRLSEITVPIISNEKVIGVIDSEHPTEGFYTKKDQDILMNIAQLMTEKLDSFTN